MSPRMGELIFLLLLPIRIHCLPGELLFESIIVQAVGFFMQHYIPLKRPSPFYFCIQVLYI